jgi:uncharacterized protein YdaL
MMKSVPCLAILFLFPAIPAAAFSDDQQPKKVLIVVEGPTMLKSPAVGDGRQLATLLGHFNVKAKVLGVQEYGRGEMKAHDMTFYIGFHARNPVPDRFVEDVLATDRPVIWLNTGFQECSARPGVRQLFGFTVSRLDSTGEYTLVRMGDRVFQKGEPNLNTIEIADKKKVTVLATAVSAKTQRELPYIVRSGNLLYIADSPFASAGESDRYLLFADMLHDIIGEQHETSHTALIRIEDVNPMENPDRLREVADILSGRGIPFLVGVSPFYVNPGEGVRVSLSDKPEIVDALKYMVQNGGTIVMHGVTHQYKGITGSDYEFWDESTNRPIRDETVESIARKLDMGIQEFMRNGLYPLVWETPHYTASFRLYETIAKYFSTAMEQRLAIEDFDYSQMFPYVIEKDLFGQKVYPENLGYIPLDPDKEKSEGYVRALLANAKTNLAVRDGFASCFFHAFVDHELLQEIVDGVQALGYTYMDMRDQTHWVHMRDRAILAGTQDLTVTLEDQFLHESWFARNGEMVNSAYSEKRFSGSVTRSIQLEPGQFYTAEPAEFRERKETVMEGVVHGAENLVRRVLSNPEQWKEARPAILWNHFARGAAFNDQASFAAVLRSINLTVDTIFVGQVLDLGRTNLLIVPFSSVDSLRQEDFDRIANFVESGGNLITDAKNDLITNFGVTFSTARLKISRVRDRRFPDERVRWRDFELLTKFDVRDVEEVFCVDEMTEAPLVIGKKWGKGRVIFFGTRFDPLTQQGYSRYPYLLEYVRGFFHLGPIMRRDNLEVYFDHGYRRNFSTEQLVKQWVAQGVRILHVGAWHEYPKYTFDYERLVRLAHANGILVYAWIEPPQVSWKFWLEHPEWREKNYRGEDVRPSWRYPVALTDEQCVRAMVAEYRTLLEKFDWDGVNLAELYCEAGRGFQDPQLFTPMHPSAQREFKKRYGIDLPRVLDPASADYWKTNARTAGLVVDYRVQVLDRVYRELLDMMTAVAREREGFQVIVTAMDAIGSPELREYIGVDMQRILALQKSYGFLLQVEDPENLWSSDPRRYEAMGKRYAELLGDRSALLLDLNILSFRSPEAVTPFPTLIQTGTESFQLIHAASLGAPRLTIYSESSVNAQDMTFLPYALASETRYRMTNDGYVINSPYAVTLKLPPETKEIRVDGAPLSPMRENMFLIPAGDHAVTLSLNAGNTFSTHALETRILSFTGNMMSVAYGMRSAAFTYEATTRTLISLNREPTAVKVDGQEYRFVSMKGNDCYSLFLPAGKHSVDLLAGNVFSYGVNLTSFWSTTAIAIFGALAVVCLVGMYLLLKVIRRSTAPAANRI